MPEFRELPLLFEQFLLLYALLEFPVIKLSPAAANYLCSTGKTAKDHRLLYNRVSLSLFFFCLTSLLMCYANFCLFEFYFQNDEKSKQSKVFGYCNRELKRVPLSHTCSSTARPFLDVLLSICDISTVNENVRTSAPWSFLFYSAKRVLRGREVWYSGRQLRTEGEQHTHKHLVLVSERKLKW